jgi:hypothetical protein
MSSTAEPQLKCGGSGLFTCFTKLPAELRHKIWSLTCKADHNGGPRIQSIMADWWVPYLDQETPQSWRHYTISRNTLYPAPSVLHICRESRNIALTIYKAWPHASGQHDTYNSLVDSGNMVYVNEGKDIFYFDCHFLPLRLLAKPKGGMRYTDADVAAREDFFNQCEGIRHVALDEWFFDHTNINLETQEFARWLNTLSSLTVTPCYNAEPGFDALGRHWEQGIQLRKAFNCTTTAPSSLDDFRWRLLGTAKKLFESVLKSWPWVELPRLCILASIYTTPYDENDLDDLDVELANESADYNIVLWVVE